MIRILRWLAPAAVAVSMTSCGIPGAAMRSAGHLVRTLAPVAAAAAL